MGALSLQFKVRPSTRLGKNFLTVCSKWSLTLEATKNLFDDKVLDAHQTVGQQNMEDGDVIRMMIDMVGD